jgi:hypothetical protein
MCCRSGFIAKLLYTDTDRDIFEELQKMPADVRNTPVVERAKNLHKYMRCERYDMVAKIAAELSYVELCAMQPWINRYREKIVEGMHVHATPP